MGRQEQRLRGVSEDGGKCGLQYFKRDFGTAHYTSRLQANQEIATHDSQRRLGQGLHIAKRKFFAVSTLSPQARSRFV